jgi:hypothetical protein
MVLSSRPRAAIHLSIGVSNKDFPRRCIILSHLLRRSLVQLL